MYQKEGKRENAQVSPEILFGRWATPLACLVKLSVFVPVS